MPDHLDTGGPQTVPQALGRLRVALNDGFVQAARELGLTPQQAEVLCTALRPRSVGEIARLVRSDRSNISRVADHLHDRGLIVRRGGERDGRVSMIELTADGRKLAECFIASLEALTQPLRAQWSAQRESLAVELLNALAGAIERTVAQRGEAPQGAADTAPEPELWLLGIAEQASQAARPPVKRA
jgi:DNA-binding MarR family transcriptional regulator